MTEMLVERVEVEAPVEEVFDFWSDAENFCAFVRRAEETRRVDLSESSWFLKGPPGRGKKFEPDAFRGCLRKERLGSEFSRAASERWADVILDRGEIDVKYLSSGRTLVIFTAFLADRAGKQATYRQFAGSSDHADRPDRDTRNPRQKVNLDFYAIAAHLFPASWSGARERLWENFAVAANTGTASTEKALTDEDRAWLESDLSRLDEYDPYELTEEQLAEEQPIRYVPGLGLVVKDDGDDASVG